MIFVSSVSHINSHHLFLFIVQPAVAPVDEYGALMYAGRWGLHGISLPGRVTFAPGNVGFSTFGAPRPMEVFEKLYGWAFHAIVLYFFFTSNFLFASFASHHCLQTQTVNDETWKLIDDIWDKRIQEMRDEASAEVEEEKEKPQLLIASHFL